jgi:hypothetical protein
MAARKQATINPASPRIEVIFVANLQLGLG